MSPSPFPPEQHDRVVAHLTEDHGHELTIVARAFGGGPGVTGVVVDDLDLDGLYLTLAPDGRELWVPYLTRLHTGDQLDRELAGLVRTARSVLGLPPGPDPV